MSAVNEWVVREFFESLGYLVSQPRKHVSPGRHKKAEEEVDLVVYNPQIAGQEVPDHLVWETPDLAGIARAVVGIRGWHTDRFYVSTLEQTPEILRFAEKAPVEFAASLLGDAAIAKILCLPRLPASGALKKKTIDALREKGIDGVIAFGTLLGQLVAKVDTKRNYEKSDLLQIIRILKNYDLLKSPQMEFFEKRRRRKA